MGDEKLSILVLGKFLIFSGIGWPVGLEVGVAPGEAQFLQGVSV